MPSTQPESRGQPGQSFDPVESLAERGKRLRAGFADFWAVWPRKENERKAWQKWNGLAPDPALTETILAAARAWALVFASRPPDKIPIAWGWLEDQRWTDALPPPPDARPARGPAKAPDPDLAYARAMAKRREEQTRKDSTR